MSAVGPCWWLNIMYSSAPGPFFTGTTPAVSSRRWNSASGTAVMMSYSPASRPATRVDASGTIQNRSSSG